LVKDAKSFGWDTDIGKAFAETYLANLVTLHNQKRCGIMTFNWNNIREKQK
jgi:hypothetical protein